MTAQGNREDGSSMLKDDILNGVFGAVAKLELMNTLLGVLIDTVEDCKVGTVEENALFASKRDMICDLLHIAVDDIYNVRVALEALE